MHGLRYCHKFLKMSVEKREEVVDKYGYCSNCLAQSHDFRGCPSLRTCQKCDRFHHTLLHPPHKQPKSTRTQEICNLKHQQHHQKAKAAKRNSQQKPDTSTSQQTAAANARTKPEKRTTGTAQPTLTAAPDARVIVDAIRSLANILCVTDTK